MVMSMGTSVFAASGSYTISITNSNGATDHTYSAYQIFTGEVSGNTLSDIAWASDDLATALLTVIKNDSTTVGNQNQTLADYFGVDNNTTSLSATTVASVLNTYNGDTGFIEAFEAALYTAIQNANITAAGTSTYDTSTSAYSDITVTSAGYYLIVDTTTTIYDGDARSYHMLQVVGNVDLTTKDEVPTITKTITSSGIIDSDSKVNTAAGDSTVSFLLTSSVPNMTGYASYSYVITDTLGVGFAIDVSTLKLTIGTAVTNVTIVSKDAYDDLSATDKASTYCYYEVSSTTNGSVETTLTITFTDAFQSAWEAGTFDTKDAIYISYSATLVTAYASTGSTANTNGVTLTYSNDPTDSSKSTTVEDKTETYTTTITVYKVDSTGQYVDGLEGAKFTLSGTGSTSITEQVLTITSSSGATTAIDLSAGTYKLSETKTPDGYNSVGDFSFTLECDENGIWSISDTESGYAVSLDNSGNIVITVTNTSGLILPTTGGIGTTMFYVVGMILVLGAAVVLVTRRRMASRA